MIFRGQNRIYPNILPSLLRPNVSDEDRREWWMVVRHFISARDGLTGYQIQSPHDAIAIVQHYLVKSPVIDVTGTPEIALYFALQGPSVEQVRVVYAIDVDAVKAAGCMLTDHSFLVLPFEDGGRKHRWLRQDGLTLGVREWADLDRARSLDFAHLPGLKHFQFRMQTGEEDIVANLGDLETTEGDPLASKVREVFESIAQHLGCRSTVRRLMPPQGTVDGHGLLLAEVNELIDRARILCLPSEDIRRIERCRTAMMEWYWDISWDCEFRYWREKVDEVANQKKFVCH